MTAFKAVCTPISKSRVLHEGIMPTVIEIFLTLSAVESKLLTYASSTIVRAQGYCSNIIDRMNEDIVLIRHARQVGDRFLSDVAWVSAFPRLLPLILLKIFWK